MDLRYERLRYFLFVNRRTHTGVGYYERWHTHGAWEKPREDRYKNIDRTTIRRPVPDAKTTAAQLNEVLCKVLAHNLCCLVQSMYEPGIQPEFWIAS